jgi:hypothetical protein
VDSIKYIRQRTWRDCTDCVMYTFFGTRGCPSCILCRLNQHRTGDVAPYVKRWLDENPDTSLDGIQFMTGFEVLLDYKYWVRYHKICNCI